jgi:hypothetical protein
MPEEDKNKVHFSLDFGPLAETATKVRLRGGVVGKLSTVLIVASIALGAIGVAAHNEWIAGGAVILIFVLVLTLGWKMLRFAEEHPQAALMEGAELLMHERLTLAMKGHPEFLHDPSQESTDPAAPLRLAQPDDSPSPSTEKDV